MVSTRSGGSTKRPAQLFSSEPLSKVEDVGHHLGVSLKPVRAGSLGVQERSEPDTFDWPSRFTAHLSLQELYLSGLVAPGEGVHSTESVGEDGPEHTHVIGVAEHGTHGLYGRQLGPATPRYG